MKFPTYGLYKKTAYIFMGYIHKTDYPHVSNSHPTDYIHKTEFPHGFNSQPMDCIHIHKTECPYGSNTLYP